MVGIDVDIAGDFNVGRLTPDLHPPFSHPKTADLHHSHRSSPPPTSDPWPLVDPQNRTLRSNQSRTKAETA